MKLAKRFIFLYCLTILIFGFNAVKTFAQTEDSKPQVAANKSETEKKLSEEEAEILPVVSPKTTEKTANNYSNILNRAGVQTTQTLPLSLNEAIRKALENNNSIEVARDDVRYQETQLRSILGNYDPVVSVSPTFSRSSTTGSTSSNDFRLNAGLDKLIRPGGGRISSFFNNSQTGRNSSNNTTFNQTSSLGTSASTTYFSSVGINYTQPLFRNFGVDNTRRQIKIQRKRLQQSDADFRRQTIEIITQVQRAYWDLVFALRDQQNRLANLNLSKENLRQVEAKIEAGAAAPLARAEVATELANREGDVLLATQQVSVTENTLKTLLLRDPTAPEWSQSLVPVDKPVITDEPIVVEDAVKDAIENRPELSRLRLQKEINTIDVGYFKNQTKPQIDLVSSFSLGGLALSGGNLSNTAAFPIIVPGVTTNASSFLLSQINVLRAAQNPALPPLSLTDIPTVTPQGSPGFLSGGTFQSLGNLFRADAPNYSVGVTFSFPLGNRTAKANLAGAKIQQQQTDASMRLQEQTVVSEVRNAVQAVETARQRVFTARRAVENAEIQLAGEQKLFEVGRSTTFLLFQRENTLTNARNSEIRAETDYNKSLSDLQRATSTTFRLNNIEVDSPIDK
ncbi:MAG: TolC family protein [Acidobacteriota bacterium]